MSRNLLTSTKDGGPAILSFANPDPLSFDALDQPAHLVPSGVTESDAPVVGITTHEPASTGETQVNTYADDGQADSAIATLPNGGHVIVWVSSGQDGDGAGIYMQRFDASGAPDGGETLVNTVTSGFQLQPAVATLADGSVIVTWQTPDTSQNGIAAQLFDASGAPVGGQAAVNITETGLQKAPEVAALAGGGYVIIWDSFGPDGSGYGVYMQRYDASGATVGGEALVNTTTSGSQSDGAVTGLEDGGYIVSWSSSQAGGGIYTQRYDASGVAQGGETLVGASGAGNQNTDVTPLADGGWLIVWQAPDGDGDGVFAQRFDASGAAVGGEVQLNSYTVGVQYAVTVTGLPDGGYAAAWASLGQDGSGEGIYARRFGADGTPDGAEQQVNSFTTGNQSLPAIAAGPDGSYVVTWTSTGQDGDGDGVYSQRFDSNFAAIEQVALDLKTIITLGDVDDSGGSYTLILSVDSGVLAVDPGTSGAGVDDSDPANIVITGTLAQIQALLDTDGTSSVTYTADSDTPPASAQFTVTVDDGTDQASDTQTILITAVNDAPLLDLDFTDSTVTGNDSATAWQEGDTPVALAFAVELDDDNTSYDGATVTAAFTANGDADDRLTILSVGDNPGEIRFDGTDVFYEGTLVGTVTGGTDGSTPLVITFNEDACHCAVQLTIASIAYSNASSSPAENDRTVSITLVDGGGTANGGGDTASANVTISVSDGTNIAPTVDIDAPVVPVGGEVLVNTAGGQSNPRIAALDDGGYVVVWSASSADSSTIGIYAQLYDADGTPRGGEFLIDLLGVPDITKYSVSGLEGGGFVVTWQDVALPFGRFVQAQRFDALGDPEAIAVQVTPLGTGTDPVVTALSGGGYVVTWLQSDGNGIGVHAQIYDATDTPVGSNFIANTNTTGTQTLQSVGSLADGGFVVAWTSFNTDSNFTEIFAQRFDASGDPVGSEFLVPDGPGGDQGDATVIGLANGGFAIAWTNFPNINDVHVRIQIYDAAGDPVGSEFAVDTTSSIRQVLASLTALADGGFLVSWQGGGASTTEIYAQRFDASGAEVGDEYLASEIAGYHTNPVAAGLAGGGFAVAWRANQDSAVDGVYARAFAPLLEATEQVPLDLKGHITIGDVDAGSDIITVILEVSEGVLNVDPGTSGVSVDDSDQQYIVLTGTLAELQDLLGPNATSSVTYTYDDDFLPVATIELAVTVNDGTDNTTDTVTIDLTPVNDAALLDLDMFAPGNDAVATYVAGDPATPIAYDATFDDDNIDWDGATLTIAITGATADDQLIIDDMLLPDTTVTGNEIYYDGDLIGTFTGGTDGDPLVITFNALACACAVEEVTYGIAYSNSEANPTAGTRDVVFTFVDGDGTANGGEDTATATVELTITPGPTPPVIDEGAAATGLEATAIELTGITITDDGDPVTGLITVQLGVEHGTIAIRTDVPGGIDSSNIVNSASGHGITIIGTPDQINATLAAANGLTYTGDSGFTGADALTIRANDGTPDTPIAISSLGVEPFFDFPSAVAFHDIDGDGLDDLMLGLGDGTDPSGVLILSSTFDAFGMPSGAADAFAFGDFDGDGEVDIAVASYIDNDSGYVGYLSSVTGDFQIIATVPSALDLVSGDFNGDSLMDLAVANSDGGNIAILLQTSPGLFTAPVYSPATSLLTVSIRTGDFNDDGVLDLLASNYGDVSSFDPPGSVDLFLGNGDGSFAAATQVWTGVSNADHIVVGDFNGDGYDDFAFASVDEDGVPGGVNGVQVVLGNGDGTFGAATGYVTTATGTPHDIQSGDLNGDGILDLVVTNLDDPGTVSILVGNGDGSFQAAVDLDAGDYPYVLALGDPDDDGDLDLIVGAAGDGTFEAFNNDGIARGSTATKGITVNAPPPNVIPQATNLNAAESYVEDTRIRLATIAVTDSDAGDTITATLTLSNAAAGALSTGTRGSATSTYDSSTGIWTVSGALADVNFLLNKVQFQPAANFNGDFTITTSISDGVAAPVTGTKSFTGTAVNDAPSGTDAAYGVSRGVNHVVTADEFGFTDAIDGNDFAGVTLTTLPTTGRLYLDGAKVSAGQTVSAADIIAGKLVYQPMPGASSPLSASFTFRVHDNGGTTNSGVDTDQSANTLTYNVVNRAPTGGDSTVTVTIGAGHIVTLAEFGFNDADGNAFASVTIDTLPASGRFLYSASGGPGVPVTAGQVISAADIAAGKLVFKPAGATASFTFQVHDDGGTAFGGADTDASPNTMTFSTSAPPPAPHVEDDMALVVFALGGDAILPDHGLSDPMVFEGPVTRAMLLHDVASHAALVTFDDSGDDLGGLIDAMAAETHLPFIPDDDAGTALFAHIPAPHDDFYGL